MNKEYTILTDSNISKDSEQMRVAFYANIGYFIQISQMLEFNLRKLICYVRSVNEIESGDITKERVEQIHKKYDDYYLKTYKDKLTLGRLNKELAGLNLFTPDVLSLFNDINEYRITVVHMIFQNNVISNGLENSGNVLEYMVKRLVPMSREAEGLNELVIKAILVYQEDFREYKDS